MSIFSEISRKTLVSVFNKRFFIPLALSTLVSAVILQGMIIVIQLLFTILEPLLASSYPWVQKAMHLGTTGGAVVIAFLLFPSLIPLIGALFREAVTGMLEHTYPPNLRMLPPFRRESLKKGLTSSMMMLGINCLLLPVYLMPIVSFFAYIPINGYMLGYTSFLSVAIRYKTLPDAVLLYKRHRRTIWITGMTLPVIAYLPFIKLLAPFISIVVMVHLIHTFIHRP